MRRHRARSRRWSSPAPAAADRGACGALRPVEIAPHNPLEAGPGSSPGPPGVGIGVRSLGHFSAPTELGREHLSRITPWSRIGTTVALSQLPFALPIGSAPGCAQAHRGIVIRSCRASSSIWIGLSPGPLRHPACRSPRHGDCIRHHRHRGDRLGGASAGSAGEALSQSRMDDVDSAGVAGFSRLPSWHGRCCPIWLPRPSSRCCR